MLLNAVNLCTAEAFVVIVLEADWMKPSSGFIFISFNLYREWLISIACLAEKPIRINPQQCVHSNKMMQVLKP